MCAQAREAQALAAEPVLPQRAGGGNPCEGQGRVDLPVPRRGQGRAHARLPPAGHLQRMGGQAFPAKALRRFRHDRPTKTNTDKAPAHGEAIRELKQGGCPPLPAPAGQAAGQANARLPVHASSLGHPEGLRGHAHVQKRPVRLPDRVRKRHQGQPRQPAVRYPSHHIGRTNPTARDQHAHRRPLQRSRSTFPSTPSRPASSAAAALTPTWRGSRRRAYRCCWLMPSWTRR